MIVNLSAWVEEGSIRQYDGRLEGLVKFAHMTQPIGLKLIGENSLTVTDCSFYFWNNLTPAKEKFPVPQLARTQTGPSFPMTLGPLAIGLEPDDENPEPQYSSQRFHLQWCGQNGPLEIDLENVTIEFLKGNDPCPAPPALLASGSSVPDSSLSELLCRLLPTRPEGRRYPQDSMDELRELDQSIEGDWPEAPVHTLFDPAYPVPDPDRLCPAEVETEIKVLLAQLARLGVCVDLCPHLRGRPLLEVLLTHVLQEPIHVSQLIPIHGLEHFPLHSFCPTCQAQEGGDELQ